MPTPKSRARTVEPPRKARAIEPREVKLEDLDSKHRLLFDAWMDKYIDKAAKIDHLKLELEEIKLDRIEPLRIKLGLTKITSPAWFITRFPGKPSLDKDKVRRYLFEKGVSLEIIAEAFAYGTSIGKPYTEIKRRKEKE